MLCDNIEGWVDFPDSSAAKESAWNAGDLCSIPRLGRNPGEGKSYPLQCSGTGKERERCFPVCNRNLQGLFLAAYLIPSDGEIAAFLALSK